MKVWQHVGDFDATKASPITWLATIARNRAIDEVRRRKPEVVQEEIETIDVAGNDSHPLDALDRSQDLQALMACLNMLDKEKRDIILLAYCRGMSRDDLSKRYLRRFPPSRPGSTVVWRS